MILINIGTIPNDNTGDALRTSFFICNENFEELALNKADLVNGKILPSQLPNSTTITVSTTLPSGTPANGDQWIVYTL